MVRITLIKDLVEKYSMGIILQKARNMVDGVDQEAFSAISEAMFRHDLERQTLPKNPNIRRALLALKSSSNLKKITEEELSKLFDEVTGKDLYDLVENEDLVERVKNNFLKTKFDSMYPPAYIFNLLKNYEYGKYDEEKYVEAICVLLNWKIDDLKFKDPDWHHVVIDNIDKLMTLEEFLTIEKNLPLSTPLTKVGETARIACYKDMLAKLITLK